MINSIVLNLILIMFPMLVYFIYNCYRELKCEEYNVVLLDVSLFSSIYLCFKYGDMNNVALALLMCNLPIIVAYLKGQLSVAVVLSLIVGMYFCYSYDVDMFGLVLKYSSYFFVYLWGKSWKVSDNKLIIAIVILQGFFLSFDYFVQFDYGDIVTFISVFGIMLIFYLLPFFLLYLFRLADKITSLHMTVSELEKDMQIKDSLFKITHEVKNPIAVCKGYLDMLDTSNIDCDKVRRYVPIIRQEIGRSLDIMSDFMEFSKININKEIIDVNMLLEDIESDLSILINNKNIKFSCDLVDDEIYIEGDYSRLKQVFINMVKNSMEAIEGKGKIEIVAKLVRDCYLVEISDNGCGMDKETLSHVKDMFYTTKVKGTGLGVSLSNEIIEAHGGSINYSSEEGIGTKVVVSLPISML